MEWCDRFRSDFDAGRSDEIPGVVVGNRVMLAGMISDQKGEGENEIDGDPKKEAAPGRDLMRSLIPQG